MVFALVQQNSIQFQNGNVKEQRYKHKAIEQSTETIDKCTIHIANLLTIRGTVLKRAQANKMLCNNYIILSKCCLDVSDRPKRKCCVTESKLQQ